MLEQAPIADGVVSNTRPPNKRKKIQSACHPCRIRKTGCDGKQPCCTTCLVRGWQDRCGYQSPNVRADASAITLVELDRRLLKLEYSTSESTAVSASSRDAQPQHRVSSESPRNPKEQSRASADNVSPSETHAPVQDSNSSQGLCSNFSFVQRVASVIGPDYDEPHRDPAGNTVPARVVSTSIGYPISLPFTPEYNVQDLLLPPRQYTDNILQCYWELFHTIFPVLHQPSFDAAYDQLWQPTAAGHTHDIVFYSTLNIVLALGCQRNEAIADNEREGAASEFYKRSLRLVSVDTLDSSSLQVVQLLLLRGFYLCYTPYVDRCWSTVGVALRVAQAAGLQSMKGGGRNQLDQQMRRRVWHLCVILDWTVSISFDRQMALPLGKNSPRVPLPAPIDDEYLSETGEGRQPPGIPSSLDFLVYAMKLLEIIKDFTAIEIQHREMGTLRKVASGQELGDTLDIISDLEGFLDNLPPHLRTDHPLSGRPAFIDACFRMQAVSLKARVMYARMRVLRPMIVVEANRCISEAINDKKGISNPITSPRNRLRQDLCALCVKTAHDVLSQMHHQISTVCRVLPWRTLYSTFAAASILIAAKLCPFLEVDFDRDPCKTSWNKAIETFEFHQTQVASAATGIEALKRFRHYVETRGSKSYPGECLLINEHSFSASIFGCPLTKERANSIARSGVFAEHVPLCESGICSYTCLRLCVCVSPGRTPFSRRRRLL
ncbi:fungal-specific transcription factor domain-containing protein [Podospora appendiculata]|uniref:Fungal-specific transcription factor domain-containing protein n=1 Tax=Podospora appendiculata TaxID=314037 RepID=A0AAE0XGL4_9PEZI|nr:fungal-specific transcription factor domain-containing protein [Podospora appendiculata]